MNSDLAQTETEGLSDDSYIHTIDRLRELGIADKISLPQLVVVGDQSSGKSSVLESLTGFAFPRAPGLCTRYATQITCQRLDREGVDISIIPRQDSDDLRQARLKQFKHSLSLDQIAGDSDGLAEVFTMANEAMGIRSTDSDAFEPHLTTFTEDILKIEIVGPSQQHLTIIDVPGIFRTATKNLTTDDDIRLVNNMVRRYMEEPRTVILAVIPCNVDIATQEVLKLAENVDPQGLRTMGVLTKPDLAPEKATQQVVCDLVLGRKNTLRLGYYLVKNRGPDEDDQNGYTQSRSSILAKRRSAEQAFFSSPQWNTIANTRRTGVDHLKTALRDLLRSVSKKEFKNVAADVAASIRLNRQELEKLGDARTGPDSQRRYLGKMSNQFQLLVKQARDNQYNDPIFNDARFRLITNVVSLNERFNELLRTKGHTRKFDDEKPEGSSGGDDQMNACSDDQCSLLDGYPELADVAEEADFICPGPQQDSLKDFIQTCWSSSRGLELGTFSDRFLNNIFREQAQKWAPLTLSHVSKVILNIHHLVFGLLREVCNDNDVRDQLWESLLQDKVLEAYKRAMEHAKFLLDIELRGPLTTLNHYFNSNLQKAKGQRFGKWLRKEHGRYHSSDPAVVVKLTEQALDNLDLSRNQSNEEHIRDEIHEILRSYYKVARKRFVDVVCQQVVIHFLLDCKDSPIRIFNSDMVMDLDAGQLWAIASEDPATCARRDQLVREIENLERAAEELKKRAR